MGERSNIRKQQRSKRRVWPWITAAVVVLVVGVVAWIGVRGLQAKSELDAALPLAKKVQSQIIDGDFEAARAASADLTRYAASAASLTSDPVWRVIEWVPGVGQNLTVVRELTGTVNEVAAHAVVPLVEAASGITLKSFAPVNGAIDLAPLVAAQPSISGAAKTLQVAEDRLSRLETDGTLAFVRDAAATLTTTVAETSATLTVADTAVQLIPAMLGEGGPRNYLLLFQNPAELRASGGIPGALALVHTDNGQIDLIQQASSTDFPKFDAPVLDLPADVLFDKEQAEYIQNVNLAPGFDVAGQLAAEMWKRNFGTEVDGVLSIDPVALSYLLKATGPIDLPTGDRLTVDNAVQLLLNEVYFRYPKPADQDAFFAAAAAAVFEKISAGDFDTAKLIAALTTAGSENRLYVWNVNESEQALLADTSLAGGLPASDDNTAGFGVYFNDATASKMDYYLDISAAAGQALCAADQQTAYGVEVTLTNTAPADAAQTLPPYITGGNGAVPAGHIRTIAMVYSPPGVGPSADPLSDADLRTSATTRSGHHVSQVQIDLAPGEGQTVLFQMRGDAAHEREMILQSTPTINAIVTRELAATCEVALR